MPALKNPKHEAFAQKVALGISAADSHRLHVAEDPNGSPISIDPRASKLANDDKVRARIEELRAKVAEKADKAFDMTKDKWLDRLAGIAKKAEDMADFSAATGALREIGKGAAFYAPEKVEHSGTVGLEGLTEAVAAVFRK